MFMLHGFSERSTSELSFELEGKQISVQQYYLDKHNFQLKYPELPCAVEKTPRGLSYVPPELLLVCSGQRVPNTKLFGDDVGLPSLADEKPFSRRS